MAAWTKRLRQRFFVFAACFFAGFAGFYSGVVGDFVALGPG